MTRPSKRSNTYVGAVELARERSEVEFIQLDRDLILEPLTHEWKRLPDPVLNAVLQLDENGSVRYEARPEVLSRSVQINICRMIPVK